MKRVISINKVMAITIGSIIDTKDMGGEPVNREPFEKKGKHRRKINIRQEDGSELELHLFSEDKERLRPNTGGYSEADTSMYEKADETIEIISQ
jgi:hypothetical protein